MRQKWIIVVNMVIGTADQTIFFSCLRLKGLIFVDLANITEFLGIIIRPDSSDDRSSIRTI